MAETNSAVNHKLIAFKESIKVVSQTKTTRQIQALISLLEQRQEVARKAVVIGDVETDARKECEHLFEYYNGEIKKVLNLTEKE